MTDQTLIVIETGEINMTIGNHVFIRWFPGEGRWKFDPVPSDGVQQNFPYIIAGNNGNTLYFMPTDTNGTLITLTPHPSSTLAMIY